MTLPLVTWCHTVPTVALFLGVAYSHYETCSARISCETYVIPKNKRDSVY